RLMPDRVLERVEIHRLRVTREPRRHEVADADETEALEDTAEPAVFLIDEGEQARQHGTGAAPADAELSSRVTQYRIQSAHDRPRASRVVPRADSRAERARQHAVGRRPATGRGFHVRPAGR